MTANERTTTEPKKRTIECVCGVTLTMNIIIITPLRV